MATSLAITGRNTSGNAAGIGQAYGDGQGQGQVLPRVTIQFCTQCKWMLRAAYFAQELLSTFSTSLGEVALQPSTGGTFIVRLFHASSSSSSTSEVVEIKEHLLWDRKAEGGFPETKELKRRVRDVIDPKRDLGHVDGKKDAVKKDLNSSPTLAVRTSEPQAVVEANEDTEVVTEEVSGTATSGGEGEVLNARGKIVISGGGGGFGSEDYGYCKPGDEDCG